MYQLLAYINYWLHAVNEHSLQSPFLFNFYQDVVLGKSESVQPEIELLRQSLLKDNNILEINDLGAGSRVTRSNTRTISQIARYASTPSKFSCLLTRLIQKFQPKSIIELGTSLGLNSLYMAKASKDAQIYTFEGDNLIADLAEKHFEQLACENISLIRGNLDDSLPSFLKNNTSIDLAYLDANHRYQPTLNYFNIICKHLRATSIVVIDDIHWSREMKQAWNEIRQKPEVSISIDLFEAGLLFFLPQDKGLTKSHWVINY